MVCVVRKCVFNESLYFPRVGGVLALFQGTKTAQLGHDISGMGVERC